MISPSLSVLHALPSRRRKLAPALSSPPNASAAVEQARHEPLEADRNLLEPAPEAGHDPVDDAARHHRLADAGVRWPAWARAAEQVRDRRREIVVGIQQPAAAGDDAVPIRVGIVGERDVEAVLERDQPRHRVRRGGVHPDLAVVVEWHERERGVDPVVDDLQVEPVSARDRLPVRDARSAQRVDPELGARPARSRRARPRLAGHRRTPSGSRSGERVSIASS